MNSNQKTQLQIASELLRQKMKNLNENENWRKLAAKGSIQSRKAKKILVRS